MERSGGRGKDAAREGAQGNPTVSGYTGTRNQNKNSLDDQLKKFWEEMMEDVQNTGTDLADFKTQQLPLARIKKIMKSDEDVRMISAEAPVLFAKACEFFILEMTLRAWNAAEESKRRTLTRQDVSTAVSRTEVWDFLADTVPVEDHAVGQQGGIPGRPIGVTMPPQDMASMQSQMDSYQAQYMAQMANMNSGASGGMFPPGVQPMPMMYQGGMPPGMYMQGPPVMNQQQSEETNGHNNNGEARARNQRR